MKTIRDPASRVLDVIPSDVEHLPFASRAIGVNIEGYVKVTTIDGDVARIFMVPGSPYPVRVIKVWATETTAQEILALA